MKFFTRDLWLAAQRSDSTNDASRWQETSLSYRAHLQTLHSRVSPAAFEFFLNADIHDAELLDLVIVDGSRPSPLSGPVRPWASPHNYPAKVRLFAVDALDQLVWRLDDANVRRTVVDYPSEQPLFYQQGGGFGDLGYHELTDAGSGFLRHEILFASGSSLLVEFIGVEVVSAPRSEAARLQQ